MWWGTFMCMGEGLSKWAPFRAYVPKPEGLKTPNFSLSSASSAPVSVWCTVYNVLNGLWVDFCKLLLRATAGRDCGPESPGDHLLIEPAAFQVQRVGRDLKAYLTLNGIQMQGLLGDYFLEA